MNDNYAGIYLFSTQKYAKKYLLYPKIYLLKKILISWGFAAETLAFSHLNALIFWKSGLKLRKTALISQSNEWEGFVVLAVNWI